MLKAIISARKELTGKGKITDELKEGFKRIQEDSQPSDALDQLKEFMETLQRLKLIRNEITERHKGEMMARLERGELRAERFADHG